MQLVLVLPIPETGSFDTSQSGASKEPVMWSPPWNVMSNVPAYDGLTLVRVMVASLTPGSCVALQVAS